MSIEDYFNNTYISMVQTESRGTSLNSQIEFLKTKIPYASNKSLALLDQCCGHGRHLKKLRTLGLENLSGIDINDVFINYATDLVGAGVKLVCADVFSFSNKHCFDFIINMESSLVSFSKEKLDELFNFNYSLLKSNGVFIFHLFNPNALKTKIPKKTWLELESGGYILEERHVDFNNSKLDIIQLRMLESDKGTYRKARAKISLTLHSKEELIDLAIKNNFKVAGVYGGFEGSDYDDSSKDIIIVLTKNDSTIST